MKLNIKKTMVALSVAVALSAPTAHADSGWMDDSGGKLMVLGVAGAAAGYMPGLVFAGLGACMHYRCIEAYGGGANEFAPVTWGELTAQQQNAMVGLMEFYTRTECVPSGGRGGLWSRLDEHEYEGALQHGRDKIRDDNKQAELWKDVAYNAPFQGARQKVEPDEKDGLGVHMHAMAVLASDAHVGASCMRDEQQGGGVVKMSIVMAEAWVGKDGNVHVRTPDNTPDKRSFSNTRTVSWAELDVIVKGLVSADKVQNF